jgi:hypothetical protein
MCAECAEQETCQRLNRLHRRSFLKASGAITATPSGTGGAEACRAARPGGLVVGVAAAVRSWLTRL